MGRWTLFCKCYRAFIFLAIVTTLRNVFTFYVNKSCVKERWVTMFCNHQLMVSSWSSTQVINLEPKTSLLSHVFDKIVLKATEIRILKSNFSQRSQFSSYEAALITLIHTLCLFQVTHQFSFYLYVLPIVVFSILFNIPKFFELEVIRYLH